MDERTENLSIKDFSVAAILFRLLNSICSVLMHSSECCFVRLTLCDGAVFDIFGK